MFKLRVLLQSKVVIELVFWLKEMIDMTETENDTDTKTKTRIEINNIIKLKSLY